jgi:hypothetical protein
MNRGYKTPQCQESRNLYTHVVGILSDPGPDICAGGMYSGVHQFQKFSSPKAAVASCRNSSHRKHEILLLGPNEYCPGSVKLGRILSKLNAVTLSSIGQKMSNSVTICSVGHFMFDRFIQCVPSGKGPAWKRTSQSVSINRFGIRFSGVTDGSPSGIGP